MPEAPVDPKASAVPKRTPWERQKRAQLASAGAPKGRNAVLVKPVRRFLWRLARPYFYFLQDQHNALRSGHTKLRERVARHTVRLSKQRAEIAILEAQVGDLQTKFTQLTHQFAVLRSDVDAQKNRLTIDMEDVGRLRADVDVISHVHQRSLVATNSKFGVMLVSPGELISDAVLRNGTWDDHVVALALEVAASRGNTAVDVGAHIGTVTLALSTAFKQVVCFEPNDFTYRVLQANLALNDATNVRAMNNGLFSAETVLSLAPADIQEVDVPVDEAGEFDGHAARNLGALVFAANGMGEFAANARTLDSYGIENVDFIKIDVQGADGEVLMGAWQTIEQCQPVVVFEWEEQLAENFGVKFDDIRDEFTRHGYRIDVLMQHNEKQVDYVAKPSEDPRDEPA